MALTDRPGGDDSPAPDTDMARRCSRLKARAGRWARLCSELSAHAAELKNLRDELRPGATDLAQRETQLETRLQELERREAELQHRWRTLEGFVREFLRRRKQLLVWQRDLEGDRQTVQDRHLAAAAKLELEAGRRLREAEALTEELDVFDAELCEALDQLDLECRQLRAAPANPLPRENPAQLGA